MSRKITTAFILAAGMGSRLAPLTNTMPKPLLKVAGRPLIEHHILQLASCGINKIIINLCYLGSMIEGFLGSGERYGVEIIYSRENNLLNTGGGICNAINLLGEEPFMVISADIFTNFEFIKLNLDETKLLHMILVENPNYHSAGDFALVNNQLVIDSSKVNYTYANIAVLDPKLFLGFSVANFPLRVIFKKAIQLKAATGELFTGEWYNVGTVDELELLESKYGYLCSR